MKNYLTKLYVINFTLLITHEIDSAFWHEWNLFGIPGGIQVFLILNLILIAVFLFGLEKVIKWERGAKTFSYLLSASGIFAFSIHMLFIILGNPEFRLPVSIIILLLILIVSVIQILAVYRSNYP
ncbi:hypothetical protein LJE82_04155 [bacterium BMS3Abin03]|nr:hypothetical protein [bacterium BMS3Abin03]